MKLLNKTIAYWVFSLILINSIACFRNLDVKQIKCVTNSNCPKGYSCFIEGGLSGQCLQTFGEGDAGGFPDDGLQRIDGTTLGSDGYTAMDGIKVAIDGFAGTGKRMDTGLYAVGGTGGHLDTGLYAAGGMGGASMGGALTGGTGGVLFSDARDVATTPSLLPIGSACSENAQCDTDRCIDGFCCATACMGCNACSKTLTGKDNGICAPVASGEDPHAACTDETTIDNCGNDGACDGKGNCRKVSSNQICAQGSCSSDGKTYTPTTTCNGSGACTTVTVEDCHGFECAATGCLQKCTLSTGCSDNSYCNTSTSTCASKKPNGSPAIQPFECTSGIVADGVCCNEECTGCRACTSTLNGQASKTTGQCLPVIANKTAPHNACEPNPPCGLDGTCDGVGGCHYPANGTECGKCHSCSSKKCMVLDDLTSCGAGSLCVGGRCIACNHGSSCTPTNLCQSGTISCTSGEAECIANGTKADGTSCGTGKVCNAGSCKVQNGAECSSNSQCLSNNCATGTISICCASGKIACNGNCINAGSPPTVNINPSSQSLCSGTNPTIKVTASGGSGTGYSFKWYKEGGSSPLTNGQNYNGTTTTTLTVLNATASNSGRYFCMVTDSGCAGSTTSPTSELIVNQSPKIDTNLPLETKENFHVGGRLEVVASGGTGSLSYEWYKNSQLALGMASGGTLYLFGTCDNAGNYYCKVKDEAGCEVKSNTTAVKVVCANQTYCSGDMSCPASP